MRTRQDGFSPLELMAAIAIIGLLLVAAMPYYTGYLKRAKVAEMLGLLSGAYRNVAVYYSETGRLPSAAQIETLGVKLTGKYTRNIRFDAGSFSGEIDDPELQGLRLSMRIAMPDTDFPKIMLLICGYAQAPEHFKVYGENQTTIPPVYLPHVCRKH